MRSDQILLVFPKLEPLKDFHHLPLSSLTIASRLRELSIPYVILDERIEPADTFEHSLLKHARESSIIGLTLFTGYQTHRAYEILRTAKSLNPDIRSILGGPHVTALPTQTLRSPLVDLIAIGYAEESFFNAINCLRTSNSLPDPIPGIGFKAPDGTFVIEPPARSIGDAHWKPLPFDSINLASYINPQTRRVLYVSSYGCPGICTFCSIPELRVRPAKPLSIIRDDLAYLHTHTHFRELILADATLFPQKERVFKLLEEIRTITHTSWIANARAIDLVHYSLDDLVRIRDSLGPLVRLTIGLESGSRRVAETIMKKGKGFLDHFTETLKLLARADIHVTAPLIFGIPGEHFEDIQQTIDYIRQARSIHPQFTLSTTFFRPLPATELCLQLEKRGFTFPQSLEEWASLGGDTHFKYNQWMDIPWMEEAEKTRYREAYDRFFSENKDILV